MGTVEIVPAYNIKVKEIIYLKHTTHSSLPLYISLAVCCTAVFE